MIVTTLLFLTTSTSAMTALWINNPGFDTDHRHRGGMLTKTLPPTELQIPATVTTLQYTVHFRAQFSVHSILYHL